MEKYIEIICVIASLVISTIIAVIKAIKENGAKKKVESELKISEIILTLMEEAEKYVNYSGPEKRMYVLTRVKEILQNEHFKFDDQVINEKIESLVHLSKKVNARNSDLKKLDKLFEGEDHGQ